MTLEERTIIHLNVADFAVAVERVVDSRLRGRPVVISAEGAGRAVVHDMSDEAFGMGVRKGMPMAVALRLCRDVHIVPPHPERYERAMQELLRRALPYSPSVEMPDANGHLFLDATGTGRLFGPPCDVAWRIRRAVRAELGLDPIWSVAPNKLTAKVATRVVKPVGEYILLGGEEAAFLGPLPLGILPGIERQDLGLLREFRLRQISHLAAWDLVQLQQVFGKRGKDLYQLARGVDTSPVLPVGQRPPVVRASHLFDEDTNRWPLVESVLYALVEKVGADLRKRRLCAGLVELVIDHSDGMRRVRHMGARPPTAHDAVLFEIARQALEAALIRRVRVRHIRVTARSLAFPSGQLDLFPSDRQHTARSGQLLESVDRIRARFGKGAIRVGRALAAESAAEGVAEGAVG